MSGGRVTTSLSDLSGPTKKIPVAVRDAWARVHVHPSYADLCRSEAARSRWKVLLAVAALSFLAAWEISSVLFGGLL